MLRFEADKICRSNLKNCNVSQLAMFLVECTLQKLNKETEEIKELGLNSTWEQFCSWIYERIKLMSIISYPLPTEVDRLVSSDKAQV